MQNKLTLRLITYFESIGLIAISIFWLFIMLAGGHDISISDPDQMKFLAEIACIFCSGCYLFFTRKKVANKLVAKTLSVFAAASLLDMVFELLNVKEGDGLLYILLALMVVLIAGLVYIFLTLSAPKRID